MEWLFSLVLWFLMEGVGRTARPQGMFGNVAVVLSVTMTHECYEHNVPKDGDNKNNAIHGTVLLERELTCPKFQNVSH